MNKNILTAAISPHPPIIIPEVGAGEEKKAQKAKSKKKNYFFSLRKHHKIDKI